MLVGVLGHFVLYRWAVACWSRLARHRWIYAGVVVALTLASPALRWIYVHKHVAIASQIRTLIQIEFLAVVFVMVPLAIIRGVSLVAVRLRKSAPAPATDGLSRRQVIEAAAGTSFLAATGSMFGWGVVRGRHAFEIDELVVRVAGLPRALDGYTIAQVSDIHIGQHVGEREIAEGLARVVEIRPDLVVATGDLVDFDATLAPILARKLADLAPRDGVLAILGNHDHYAGSDEVVRAMRAAGIEMLVNAGRLVRASDGGGFALLGVDDLWATRRGSRPDLDRALAMVPSDAPRILLSHQPASIHRWAGRVALQLSGHTHGGQINPGFRPADFVMRYVAGRFEVGGTTLYVNRGFGTVGPPARVGSPPEITKVVLVAG